MEEDFSTLDDGRLAERVAAGDARAIAVLYDRYATPAFSLALHLGGDPQQAAEIVERTFARVWADASRFDPRQGRFGTWLLSIVNYLATPPRPGRPPAVAPRSVAGEGRRAAQQRPRARRSHAIRSGHP